MSCFKSADPDKVRSKQLDKEMAQWIKPYNKAIKLLLLGAGESGKTTIVKQMKILHISGFSESERREKLPEIRDNIRQALKELTNYMNILSPPVQLEKESNTESVNFISNLPDHEENVFEPTPEFFEHAKNLWVDKGVIECFKRCHEFPVIDGAKYFLDKIDAIKDDNYLPSDQDILRSRKRTAQIQRVEFEVKIPIQYGGGSQLFWLYDVGGQRGERKKWIQVFQGITAVLYLVSVSSFDARIREDTSTNNLRESINLFTTVWASRYLQETSMILFLNKQDQLEEKIKNGIGIGKYFRDYSSYKMKTEDGNAKNEYEKTRSFIRDKFLEITQRPIDPERYLIQPQGSRSCYWHYTTATDTNNIKLVFNDVHKMIIKQNLDHILV